jgi:hypothetical protein
MTIPESVRTLVATGPLAHLTTLNSDGSPQVTVNYRWRLGLAEGEANYDNLEKRLPRVPSSACQPSHLGKYSHQTINGGVGHNLAQEAPEAFADEIVEVDGY